MMLERITKMNNFFSKLTAFRLFKDRHAQDLIEYAIMAGFVAVASGATMPGAAGEIQVIFAAVTSAFSSSRFVRRGRAAVTVPHPLRKMRGHFGGSAIATPSPHLHQLCDFREVKRS
jgi:Flp pilus assembly pilin Flp